MLNYQKVFGVAKHMGLDLAHAKLLSSAAQTIGGSFLNSVGLTA